MLRINTSALLCGLSVFLFITTACDQKQSKKTSAEQVAQASEEVTVSEVADTVSSEDPKGRMVQVATLGSAEANNQFTQNVQIMQGRVREIAGMNDLFQEEQDSSAKQDIEKQIQEMLRRVNEDNALMAKTYGYNLNRKYIRNIEKATVYVQLTDEDVTSIKKKAAEDGSELPSLLDMNLLSICSLNTPKAVQGYQKDVSMIQSVRDEAIQLEAALESAETSTDKAYAQGRLSVVMDQLNALNSAMHDAYGFSINRNYVLQVDQSSLYVWASESELANVSE